MQLAFASQDVEEVGRDDAECRSADSMAGADHAQNRKFGVLTHSSPLSGYLSHQARLSAENPVKWGLESTASGTRRSEVAIHSVNRRLLMQGLGTLAFSVPTWRNGLRSFDSTGSQKESASTGTTEPLPAAVAGVRLVDSKIGKIATELTRTASPPYLFNHSVRTFLFGSLVGRARKQSFDEEVLYLACILHDLGLTEQFQGDLPFEIQGAEAAKRFLEQHTYAKDRAGLVWDGIAMHASLIGQFKQPEIALVGDGAAVDVVGPDFSEIRKADVEAVLHAYPRLRFKDAFVKTCVDVVRKHPGGASRSFMRDVGERYVTEFHPRNFCDLVMQAPFEE